MNGDGRAERLLESGVDALAVTAAVSSRPGARHVASRPIRRGTAGGARHAEARGARIRADFVHKLRLAVKEMRESVLVLAEAHRSGGPGRATSTERAPRDG